jgi:cyclohexanone monooxygenase
MMLRQPDHEIVVVGAGFSGIGASIKLQEAGFDDHVLLEEGDGVGGTWHWNTYPGIGVDIPSYSYQFSFEQRGDWSRVYAHGHELKAYAEHCADRYDVRRRVRFGTRVAAARFDEDAELWVLTTTTGEELAARFVIGATGVLTQPKRPDVPGLDAFAGTTMHTARWDHDVDLRGARVGIIGTGASAVQVIPSIAEEVEHLTVFQRTPIWCLPRPDGPVPAPVRAALSRVPGAKALARLAAQAFVEATFPIPAHFDGIVKVGRGAEALGRAWLRSQVHDPATRAALTPAYGVGCKRPSFSNTYLATFNRDDVTLETSPIERITPRGVRCADGRHDLDVLLLATGFQVMEATNMPPFRLTGRGDVELAAWWGEHRMQAYQGVSVPGFPNYFAVLGPYAYNGASYFTLIENQVRHIVRCLRRARDTAATTVEVTAEANERYFREMLGRRDRQIFFQPSCAGANSYYFDEHGDVPFRSALTLEAAWRSARFDLADYRFSAPAGAAAP